MTPQTTKVLITAGLLAVAVTIIVMMNTPTPQEAALQRNKTVQLFKVFVIAFIVCGAIVYIMQDNDQNAMMTNIIKGDPDF